MHSATHSVVKLHIEMVTINGFTVYNVDDETGFTVRTLTTLSDAKQFVQDNTKPDSRKEGKKRLKLKEKSQYKFII